MALPFSRSMIKLGRPFGSKTSLPDASSDLLPSVSLPATPLSTSFKLLENISVHGRPSVDVEERKARSHKRGEKLAPSKSLGKVQDKRSKSKPKPSRLNIDVPAHPRRSTSTPSLRESVNLADLNIEDELNRAEVERVFALELDPFAKGDVQFTDPWRSSPAALPSIPALRSTDPGIYLGNRDFVAPDRIPLPLTPISPEFVGFPRASSESYQRIRDDPQTYSAIYDTPYPPDDFQFPLRAPKTQPPSPRPSNRQELLERAILAYPTPELEEAALDDMGLRPRLSPAATRRRLLRRTSQKAVPCQPLPATPLGHSTGCSSDFGHGFSDIDAGSTPKPRKSSRIGQAPDELGSIDSLGRTSMQGERVGLGLAGYARRAETPERFNTTITRNTPPPGTPADDSTSTPVQRSPGKGSPPAFRMAQYFSEGKKKRMGSPVPSTADRNTTLPDSPSPACITRPTPPGGSQLWPDSDARFNSSIQASSSVRKSANLSVTSRSPTPSLSEFPRPPIPSGLATPDLELNLKPVVSPSVWPVERKRSCSGRSGSPFPLLRNDPVQADVPGALVEDVFSSREPPIPCAYLADDPTPTIPSVAHMVDRTERKHSFPFQNSRQRFLGELDLMFTPRSRESLVDADDHEGSVCFTDPWMLRSGASSRTGSVACLSDDASDEGCSSIGRICLDILDVEDGGPQDHEDAFRDVREDSDLFGDESSMRLPGSFDEKVGLRSLLCPPRSSSTHEVTDVACGTTSEPQRALEVRNFISLKEVDTYQRLHSF
jgi:hypothetical protein